MRTLVPLVDLKAQYATIREEIDGAVMDTLESTDFILGRHLSLFEQEFAAYCEAKHAIGVDSGTSALELALRAYDIGFGDEVITAANTFIATALAVSYTGARPVLIDVDPGTYNLNVSHIEAAITKRTRAIIPVHLYGQPADMDPIMQIAEDYGLVVIEDACQAHGARYKGRRVGSIGHAAAFSFYPGKNLGGYGDGGMVVSNDSEVIEAIRMMRNYGQREKYHHVLIGYNRRLDTLQAAILRVKLRHLDAWNEARREHAQEYAQRLGNLPVILPMQAEYAEPIYHLYVLRAQDRDGLRNALQEAGIATGIHYPVPIHLQPAYRELGYRMGSFPVTEACAEKILSLPMYAELTTEQIAAVAERLEESLTKGKTKLRELEVGSVSRSAF